MTRVSVLIVDDEVGFATALSKRLNKRGMDTRLVTSGRDALTVLAEEEVDVTLLDVMMPGMDGIKTLGEIKRLHPDTQVLMFTAHSNSDMVISCLAMGAYDYVMKPGSLDELVGKIREAAQKRQRNLAQDSGPEATTG
ncbi:response regulator [Pseudodesulfovibrio pelocollis]|uniref:response regulator n=1 Tax=Pseudodesulfovibrio pelocollis TaxID=3051432 RepID=UPI00255AB4B7|nr:response regulator [Pseudodesulfovibrio sp. SB368]